MANTGHFEIVVFALVALIVLALLVSGTLSRSAEARGRRGERKVSSAVSRVLDDTQYHLIDNVILPFGNSTTQIDHLIVSQFGVFVIETKNMSGWIFGDEKQANWTQVIYRVRHKFQNPLRQNFKHLKTVQSLFGLNHNQVQSVVAFVGDGTFKTTMPKEVVCGTSELISFVQSKRVCVIAEEDVASLIGEILTMQKSLGRKTEREHIRNVRSAISVSLRDENVACPRCGHSMVERANKQTGERFLGCERFPRCRGIRRPKET